MFETCSIKKLLSVMKYSRTICLMTIFPLRLLPLKRTGPVTPSKEVLSRALMNMDSQSWLLETIKEQRLQKKAYFKSCIVSIRTKIKELVKLTPLLVGARTFRNFTFNTHIISHRKLIVGNTWSREWLSSLI